MMYLVLALAVAALRVGAYGLREQAGTNVDQ